MGNSTGIESQAQIVNGTRGRSEPLSACAFLSSLCRTRPEECINVEKRALAIVTLRFGQVDLLPS